MRTFTYKYIECLWCNLVLYVSEGQSRPPHLTSSLVENGEGRRGVGGVPQPDRPVGRAGEEALVGRAVDQTPHRVRVAAQRPPQHGGLCRMKSSERAA